MNAPAASRSTSASRVAALFVDPDGIYSTLPGVDCWGLPWRDARLYVEGSPVVAHPPCGKWGSYARSFFRDRLGRDGGCFASALASVLRCGGVLEHPAASSAWPVFGLAPPPPFGWAPAGVTPSRDGTGAWVAQVDQGHYGHRAPKRTWLLAVTSTRPAPLVWGVSSASGRVEVMGKRERAATPRAFAEVLVTIARDVGRRDVVERDRDALEHPKCAVCDASIGRARVTCSVRCRQRLHRFRERRGVT